MYLFGIIDIFKEGLKMNTRSTIFRFNKRAYNFSNKSDNPALLTRDKANQWLSLEYINTITAL